MIKPLSPKFFPEIEYHELDIQVEDLDLDYFSLQVSDYE